MEVKNQAALDYLGVDSLHIDQSGNNLLAYFQIDKITYGCAVEFNEGEKSHSPVTFRSLALQRLSALIKSAAIDHRKAKVKASIWSWNINPQPNLFISEESFPRMGKTKTISNKFVNPLFGTW